MSSYLKDRDNLVETTIDGPCIFSIAFEDNVMLYRQYMPFIQNGALFIPTQQQFALGDEVHLSLKLPDDTKQHQLSGQVVWITPPAAERGLAAGIGVQLMGEEAPPLRHRIERQLMDLFNVPQQNDTM